MYNTIRYVHTYYTHVPSKSIQREETLGLMGALVSSCGFVAGFSVARSSRDLIIGNRMINYVERKMGNMANRVGLQLFGLTNQT